MKFSFLLLVPIVLLAGCCKHNQQHNTRVERLVFGTFYGECAGNCVNIYSLDRLTLQKDEYAAYPSLDPAYVITPTSTMSVAKFNAAKHLLFEVPAELLPLSSNTYGAPDSHDQGGMYVEVYQGATRQRFMIDNENTADQSAALITFKEKIDSVMRLLR